MSHSDKQSRFNLLQKIYDPLAWSLSKRELHKWMRLTKVEDVVRATRKYHGRGAYKRIRAVQHPAEITKLTEMVQAIKPRVIVEIGTSMGGTLYIWCRTNQQAKIIASIDLPGGKFGGGYAERRRRLYEEFVYDRPHTEIILMRSDSHLDSTLNELKEIIGDRQIDFLYLDADHTYEGVKRDFEMYSPLVRPGGIIAFHDINTRGEGHEVYKLWEELKLQHKHQEIIEDKNGWMGNGVIFWQS